MLKHILKRLGIAVFVLLAFSFILYALMRLQPNDFVTHQFDGLIANGQMTQEQADHIRSIMGLDVNIFVGYGNWLWAMVRGDFGFSWAFQKDVTEVITDYMWLSFIMALIAFIISASIAIPMGIKAAVKQYSKFDYATTALVMMGISFPAFFFSGLIIRVFAVQFGWFPIQGLNDPGVTHTMWISRILESAWHLVLPITVMVVLGIGGLMRHARTNTLEVLRSDFIRTARAKGLGEGTVIYKHAFKNTAIPLATMMAGILPGMFAGSLIIEQIFALPGIGQRAFTALESGDIPLAMGYNMFIAILSVLGILLSDIMYVVVDPRVKMN